ncbi:hypothetical protein [Mastigocoleus testarum]|uniref:Uncharacterized protein n=1 Tax=Mastigocoleus testarum BC008 TaxID=371196 RepID=A0A0V7ZGA9_9CYAN|nr:hypothetical protein [Mastigocoleus testarum]KST63550.1 hypothetical protein BC008_13885 [Mastigocoleus testarum BC008]
METLRVVWVQKYYIQSEQVYWREQDSLPPIQEVISQKSPSQNCQFTGGLNPPVTPIPLKFLAGVLNPIFSPRNRKLTN